jgi:diacylglycerol kinase (ATP)
VVLGLEGINTAIEVLADKLHPGFDPEIGKVKDVAAGAVLIASIVAAIIGFIIFAPKFLILFTN